MKMKVIINSLSQKWLEGYIFWISTDLVIGIVYKYSSSKGGMLVCRHADPLLLLSCLGPWYVC